MNRKAKKFVALILSLAMVLSLSGISNVTMAKAASKKLKISASKVTVKVKSSKKVTLKNKPKGAKVTWTSKNKKIATVKNGKITGKKAGNTKVICKVSYKKKGKKVTKKFTVKVTVKKTSAASTTVPAASAAPTAAPQVSPTLPPRSVVGATTAPTDKETSNLGAEGLSAGGVVTKDNGMMRTNWTSKEFMKYMGFGWNYGNSLEARLDAKDVTENTTVSDHENAWNAGLLTQANVDALKKYGINTIRIPVAWSNMMSNDGKYTINDAYFNRVEEVMNYALNNEMYVIVNIHWDGDWWGQFGDADQAVRDQAWARYESFWTQIANRYKDYSDRLIFESANEELGDRLNDDWINMSTTYKTGTLTEEEQYETVNKINQKFVDIVRNSGGNNKYRYLLIAGFNTNIDKTCDDRFVMPTDTVAENGNDKLSISVHYYTPWQYCGGSEFTPSKDNPAQTDWGTDADVAEMHANFDKMKKFTEQGYGVIIGEFGVQTTGYDGIPKYFKELSTYTMENGMCPVLWDTGTWFSRNDSKFVFDDVTKVLLEVTGSTETFPETGFTTGIWEYEIADESELTPVYSWTGTWIKNDGNPEHTGNTHTFETTEATDGFEVYCNNGYHYWANVFADWNSITHPYIRVTVKDPDENTGNIKFGYSKFKAKDPTNKETMEQKEMHVINYEDFDWTGKCISVDKLMLKDADAMYLTFGNYPTITKIEIFDKK